MGLLVQVGLAAISGEPKDRVINTFAIKTQGDGHTSENLNDLAGAFETFYNVDPGNGGKVCTYLSSLLSRTADSCSIDVYDITGKLFGQPHGSPIFTRLWTLGANNGSVALPPEVACAVRLEAVGRADAPVETADGSDPDFDPDRPKMRHTGRFFVGPLTVSGLEPSAAAGFLDAGLRTTLLEATKDLAVNIGNIPDAPAVWDLGVWSRKDGVIRAAAHVVLDSAPDTQRRRGWTPAFLQREAL